MVDDDAEDIFLTRSLLRRSGVRATVTGLTSGKELFTYIKNNGIGNIDVILLDINMPIQDGFAVLQKLKKYPDISDLNIVMYSTSKREEEDARAAELGADGFVQKPERLEDMSELLKFVSRRKMARTHA
ncbi:response regulator [Hellea sp.]|nr:response regulator [Hellea sp.]